MIPAKTTPPEVMRRQPGQLDVMVSAE